MPFDLGAAKRAVGLAVEAYQVGVAGCQPVDGGLVCAPFCYLLRELPDCVLVAFQGTNNILDFIADGFISETHAVPGLPAIHTGFARAAMACLPSIEPRLASGKPLYLCGHSLGAAMSLIAAAYLSRRGNSVAAVYGFGTPTVGGADWVGFWKLTGLEAFGFIHARDPVPFLNPLGSPVEKRIFMDYHGEIIPVREPFPVLHPDQWDEIDDHESAKYAACVDVLTGI